MKIEYILKIFIIVLTAGIVIPVVMFAGIENTTTTTTTTTTIDIIGSEQEKDDLDDNGMMLLSGNGGSVDLLDGLVAYYELELDGSDSHDNEYDMIAQNNPSHVAGKIGNSADFGTGSDKYYYINNRAGMNDADQAITIAGWFFLNTDKDFGFYASWGNRDTGFYYELRNEPISNVNNIVFNRNNGTAEQRLNIPFDAYNKWVFLTITYDGSKIRAYINGDEKGDLSASGSKANTFKNGMAINVAPHGSDYWQFPLKAKADEVGYWLRQLSENEISWLYNEGNGRSYSDFSSDPDPIDIDFENVIIILVVAFSFVLFYLAFRLLV